MNRKSLNAEIERQRSKWSKFERRICQSKYDDSKEFSQLIKEQNEMTKEMTVTTMTNPGFMQVATLDEAIKAAELISKTAFCPKAMVGKVNDIVLALQFGQELGLKPLQSLQNIAIMNGRPAVYGDLLLAICRQNPDFEYIKEEYLEETNAYICRVKRRNEPEIVQIFSEADARKANLWGKEGPWKLYPRRMLQMRARTFALRDAFPDSLRGIISIEEAIDIPTKKDYSTSVGNIIDAKPLTTPETITEELQQTIINLIEQTDTSNDDVFNYIDDKFKVKGLKELTYEQYEIILEILNKKLAKKEEKDE